MIRQPWRAGAAGLTGLADGLTGHSDWHPVPVLGLLAGLPLQYFWRPQGCKGDALDGIVDGAAATAGRAIGAHWIFSATERALVGRGAAMGYVPIPKRAF